MSIHVQMSLFAPPAAAIYQRPEIEQPGDFEDPFLRHHVALLDAAGDERLRFDEDTWDWSRNSAVGCDCESFENYFSICFKRFADGKRLAFELSERSPVLPADKILQILLNNTIITFNGAGYDLPIIFAALQKKDTIALKGLTHRLIFGDARPWEIEKKFGIKVPRNIQHIDLMEPNPAVKQGLKIIHGRLHGRFIMDLPYAHDSILSFRQMNVTTLYCHNDLDATEGLYVACRDLLELRAALGKSYGMDFRSKSDAQVGESIVKKRVEVALRRKLDHEQGKSPGDFKYEVPNFVQFDNAELKATVERIRNATFSVSGSGHPVAPAWLEQHPIKTVGKMVYSMGIGGLHSTEAHRALFSDDTHFLMDVDVASQYPSIIMNLGLYPPKMGPAFLDVYGGLIKERLAAKAKMLEIDRTPQDQVTPAMKAEYIKAKVQADGGRVALNGVYGKLGSFYSPIYAPNHVIAITLTGQLAILMLIERAETAGIPVVSANTDGVVFRCPRRAEPMLDAILKKWEADTGFVIERTLYKAIYNSSVNTYIAIREDGKIKRKGAISDPWSEGDKRGQMMKNPAMTICSEALVQYLKKGTPLDETIRACQDPRCFVTVVKVAQGAKWRGVSLGRAVRYYWSLDGSPIMWMDGSKKVSKTDGSRPLPELTDELPPDIDYMRYYQEAVSLAVDLAIPGF